MTFCQLLKMKLLWRKIRKNRNYKLVAEGYDKLNLGHNGISEGEEEEAPYVYEKLSLYLIPSSKILDAGCGDGRVLKYFKDRNIIGIDISPVNIEKASQYAKCFVSTIENIDFPNNEFDLVIANVVEHLIDIEQGLKQFHRILKPNGILFLYTDNTLWQLLTCVRDFVAKNKYKRLIQPIDGDFTYWGLKRLLDKARFKILEYEGYGCLPFLGRLSSKFFEVETHPIFKYFTTRIVVIARKEKDTLVNFKHNLHPLNCTKF